MESEEKEISFEKEKSVKHRERNGKSIKMSSKLKRIFKRKKMLTSVESDCKGISLEKEKHKDRESDKEDVKTSKSKRRSKRSVFDAPSSNEVDCDGNRVEAF